MCFQESCWENHSLFNHPERSPSYHSCSCHCKLVAKSIPLSSIPHSCQSYERNEDLYVLLISPVV